MNLSEIIFEIDLEIGRLKKAKQLLNTLSDDKRGPGRPRKDVPASTRKRRTLSAEARGKIAAAQKARWAKVKKSSNNRVATK